MVEKNSKLFSMSMEKRAVVGAEGQVHCNYLATQMAQGWLLLPPPGLFAD
jgi:hypothetical protein